MPNGRFSLLSSACRSKKIREEKRAKRRSSKEYSFTLKNYWAWCGLEDERVRVKQRVMNNRTIISLKGKLGRKTWSKCSTKKYPLYRLAINPLELLERQHCEMHPSWSSFAVRLRHFLVTFCCCWQKVTGCRATPDDLELKTQTKKLNPQNTPSLLKAYK